MDKPAVPPDNLHVKNPVRVIYNFLASTRLAMALLLIILVVCIVTATFLPAEKTVRLVFSTLWFNGLLVLLVMNVACCFSGRIFGRRLTLISFGMILFHISFVTILLGIVYNSLFYFRGTIRLTEGETLASNDSNSYDKIEKGRFFSFSRIKGETSLIRVHLGYRVGNEDKRTAYEINVGDGKDKETGVIYVTNNLSHKGFSYYPEVEGHSLFVMVSDAGGRDIYGAHVPLQSLKQKDGTFVYATGTKNGAGPFPFPQQQIQPFMGLLLGFVPSGKNDRSGSVYYKVYPLMGADLRIASEPIVEGNARIGRSFSAFNHGLSVREIRYWVTMTVRHEPGKPFVLFSLCSCLVGMTITTVGRLLKRRPGRPDLLHRKINI